MNDERCLLPRSLCVLSLVLGHTQVHRNHTKSISQPKLRPIIEDAHTYTAEVLFDMVDTDSSGTIEKAEFVYMHTMVLNSEKRAAARVAEAKAAARPCCCR